jgi:cytochrome P450
VSTAPHAEMNLRDLNADPYPTLARLRAVSPIVFVPPLNATLLVRRQDILECGRNAEVFSNSFCSGPIAAIMGVNMMRKDGSEHAQERQAITPSVSPSVTKTYWTTRFEEHAEEIISRMRPGHVTDLRSAFAIPFSAECLKSLTGLTNMRWQDMDAWSKAMIDGMINFSRDVAIDDAFRAATAGIDAAIDEMVPRLTADQDRSLLGTLLASGTPMETIRANLKLTISGGQNEPRDALAGAVWALLTHPDQLELARSGQATWEQVFNEYLRWMSPIGMTGRRIAKPWSIGDVKFEVDDFVFLGFSSANRDEAFFDRGDEFDITRDASMHIAFGAGPHVCAGAAISRAMIAHVALPALFGRLHGLRIAGRERIQMAGWIFRGLLRLPVEWERTA